MAEASGTRITVEDLTTGQKESIEIEDTYVLITDGKCYLSNENIHANGTHVLTVKNSNGKQRPAKYEGESST